MQIVFIPIADKSQMLVGDTGFFDQWKKGFRGGFAEIPHIV